MSIAKLASSLKPRDAEVLALAEREADPARSVQFEPICRGPWFAVAALAVVGLLSVPGMLWRLVRALLGSEARAR
jgi:hypothetical protein